MVFDYTSMGDARRSDELYASFKQHKQVPAAAEDKANTGYAAHPAVRKTSLNTEALRQMYNQTAISFEGMEYVKKLGGVSTEPHSVPGGTGSDWARRISNFDTRLPLSSQHQRNSGICRPHQAFTSAQATLWQLLPALVHCMACPTHCSASCLQQHVFNDAHSSCKASSGLPACATWDHTRNTLLREGGAVLQDMLGFRTHAHASVANACMACGCLLRILDDRLRQEHVVACHAWATCALLACSWYLWGSAEEKDYKA